VRGGLDRFPRLSFASVLGLVRSREPGTRRTLEERFRGKIVLLGNWLSGQADVQPMPGIQVAPLVLAHATAVETILSRDYIHPRGRGTLAGLALLLALLGVAAGRFLPLPYPLLVAPALLGGFWWLGSTLLERSGLAIPTVAPALGLGLAAIGGGVLRAWNERRQLRRVSEALGRYLPRRVAHQILADPSALRLGGKRKELTVLYAELHDFATLSEQLEPEEVGELLELFFSVTGETVARHGGTLDRFNGDGVRAFFGDPLPQQEHAAIAVRCAIEIRDELLRRLGRWAGAGRPRPGLGLGLSSGYVTVGNIGTLQRMEYTVLGRHVELAEELARRARDGVLAGSRTRSLAKEIPFKQVGEAFEPAPE
jgi:adenylate cyclase